MRKRKFTDSAILFSYQSFKNERNKLIEDSLRRGRWFYDLYDALYENGNAPLRNLKFERYYLLTMKRHWDDTMVQVERLPETEYYACMKMFVKSYREYIAGVKGTILDMDFLDKNLEAIESLVTKSKNWEEHLAVLRVDFRKSEKMLEDEMDKLRKVDK